MNLGGMPVRWQYKGNSTTCRIGVVNEETISRTAKVRQGDVKEKQIGRLQSFRKAMTHAAEGNLIPRETRSNMWKAFRKEIKSPIRLPESKMIMTGKEVLQK